MEGMAWEGGATAQSALDQLRASLKVPGDYGGKYDAAPSWGPRASGPSRAEPCFCPVRHGPPSCLSGAATGASDAHNPHLHPTFHIHQDKAAEQ